MTAQMKFLSRYQICFGISMRGDDIIFDCVQWFYCKCHKIDKNRGGSYIDFIDWIKNKKPTINPINKKHNKCFQSAIIAILNYHVIRKHPERITKINPFINRYNWERIIYSYEIDEWEKIEKNNLTIALNFVYTKNVKKKKM